LEEKRHGLAAAGVPPEFVDLLDELSANAVGGGIGMAVWRLR
jgi:hypothetical protein